MAVDPALVVSGTHVFGPLSVISALFLSLTSSAIWSRNVGETSCGWRVDYSPDGRAFGIWAVIYLWSLGSAIAQCTTLVSVLDWWTSASWSLTWVFCALWVPLFDAEYLGALRSALVQISLAAVFATVGAWDSRMWIADTPAQLAEQLAVGAPLTLLAGWLLAASSINVGIVWKAGRPDAVRTCITVPRSASKSETEAEYRSRRRVIYREQYAKSPAVVSPVPLVLSAGVGGLALLIRDPLLPVPLMWAIVNLKAFPNVVYMCSLLMCACGSAAAAVRVFMF